MAGEEEVLVTETKPEDQATVQDTKEQLAEAYLNFLDQQKGGILATGAGLGINLNPLKKNAIEFLTMEALPSKKKNIFSTIKENLKKKFLEKMTWWTMLTYDAASLNKMKALITQNKDDQKKLESLMAQIKDGVDPTLLAWTDTNQANKIKNNPEHDDKNNREKVLASLNAVIEENKKSPIKYLFGWRSDPEKWFDCSGLISYTFNQAGLNSPGNSSDMFKHFDSKKLEFKKENHNISTDVSDIKEGDILFRNSTNPNYHRSTWTIPSLEKDGINYRIHHVAFIKKIDIDAWIVSIVESNGVEWVTENQINIAKELTEKDHKSELYVAHINYDSIEKKQAAAMA